MCGGGGGFGVCGGGGGLGPPPPSPVDKAKALFQYTFNCSLCLLYENSNMTARLSPKIVCLPVISMRPLEQKIKVDQIYYFPKP